MRARGVPPGHPDGPPKPNKGRGKGKIPASVKEMVLEALSDAGGIEYLKTQAEDNPAAFMQLLGKIMPTQVTGPDDGPILIQRIERVIVDHVKDKDA